ncbi:D-alanyl-D-alanine carboxypeptidase, partial [Streptomyces virginiae]|uniref:D-alanyl-D-alanine carboxypeptidase n=1 Tax=Streptomyces virginiae TaxID=1961 RepID=UPI002DBBAE43
PAPAGAGKPSDEADGRSAAGREAGSASGAPKSAGVRLPKKPAAAAPPTPAADEAADSERTAVFRAVKPGTGGAARTGSAEPKGQAADSERTAVFRVPKVDALKPDGGQKPKPPAAKPGPASAPADESAAAADSERTAVFRAPKPEAPRPDAPTSDAPKPNAPKPDAAKPGAPEPDAPKPGAPKPDAPKPSTFVPLRADGGAPKAPVPPAPPAPGSAATTTERLDHSDRSERTTQQPLPPKPPLDMLADLTNNPPPPPSPLRTAVRRVKIYAPLVVLLAVILAVVQLVRPLPEPKLVMTAKSSYTFEGAMPQLPWPTEGQAYMAAAGLGTLGQSGEQKPVPIASVTKSMTAYIILRDHPIKKGEQGAMIDVDKTAETEGKKNNSTDNESTLDTVKEGDKISEYDAIAALMIPSANNIARLLARWDSGSQEAFVKKMNDTAKELGMTNTTYTDPSGLDATTVSTAEDQVKLGLKLVEIETLLDITKKPNWVDPSGKSWRNWNGLTGPSGALGIKTGTTTKAGGNLLFAAQKKIGNTNQLIVGAVLGQHKPSIIDTVLAASKQLMTATQKALDGAIVVKKGQVVGYVDDGLGGRTPVVATADVQAIGWASLKVDVKLADGGGTVPQTAKAGTEVGLLTVGEGASQVKVPVALQSDLASPGIGSKLTRIG